MDFITIATQFGVTFAILCALAWVNWKVLSGLINWARPWLEQVIKGHLELIAQCMNTMEVVKKNSEAQTASMHAIEDSTKRSADHQEKLIALNDSQTLRLDDIKSLAQKQNEMLARGACRYPGGKEPDHG